MKLVHSVIVRFSRIGEVNKTWEAFTIMMAYHDFDKLVEAYKSQSQVETPSPRNYSWSSQDQRVGAIPISSR